MKNLLTLLGAIVAGITVMEFALRIYTGDDSLSLSKFVINNMRKSNNA